jgi:hypothetical protein
MSIWSSEPIGLVDIPRHTWIDVAASGMSPKVRLICEHDGDRPVFEEYLSAGDAVRLANSLFAAAQRAYECDLEPE